MNDEKMMKGLRTIIIAVDAILILTTVVLQQWAFEALMHILLCSCIVILTNIILIFDGILKDSKEMFWHSIWYIAFFFNLIASLFKF